MTVSSIWHATSYSRQVGELPLSCACSCVVPAGLRMALTLGARKGAASNGVGKCIQPSPGCKPCDVFSFHSTSYWQLCCTDCSKPLASRCVHALSAVYDLPSMSYICPWLPAGACRAHGRPAWCACLPGRLPHLHRHTMAVSGGRIWGHARRGGLWGVLRHICLNFDWFVVWPRW